MQSQEKVSLGAVALGASVCDRKIDEQERQAVRAILRELNLNETERGLVYRRVFMGTASPQELLRGTSSMETARKASVLAKQVCEADGILQSEEAIFLKELEDLQGKSGPFPFKDALSDRIEQGIQQYAIASEAVRNKIPVVGLVFITSIRIRLIYKLRRLFQDNKRLKLQEIRDLFLLLGWSLKMRPYALAIAHSDAPFRIDGAKIKKANEGLVDYLLTYGLGSLVQESYEGSTLNAKKDIRGRYLAAMLRGRFIRDNTMIRLPKPVSPPVSGVSH